ncbi:MAG TPA: NAD(P)/FAD-dependent oxidoreductase, partial [Bacillota bacterium]
GRVAGVNMSGGDQRYTDVPHYTTTMFDSTMTAIGMTTEVDPTLESEVYADFAAGAYRRLFFDAESRLTGAVLIGDLTPRREIARMIRERVRVHDRKQVLERLT